MKAIEILKEIRDIENDYDHLKTHRFDEAIEELEEFEAYKTNCQGAKRRLDSTITTLAVLTNENKTLANTLMKVYAEMIKLREENQGLK